MVLLSVCKLYKKAEIFLAMHVQAALMIWVPIAVSQQCPGPCNSRQSAGSVMQGSKYHSGHEAVLIVWVNRPLLAESWDDIESTWSFV